MMTKNTLEFVLDNRIVEIDFSKTDFRPSTTVLNYLRMLPEHRGTKEGCAEGDCGACTVVLGELGKDNRIHYKAVDSCMLFLASINGKQLITVENLAQRKGNEILLHSVQKAMVDEHGSQCGFCTPGIVMSLFAFYKSNLKATRENIVNALSGNLCRCTGYQSIYNAAKAVCSLRQPDHFDDNEKVIVELLKQINAKVEMLELIHNKQTYFLPKNLKQALSIKDVNADAYIVNGTTDTAIRQNKLHEYLPKIIDISAIPELKEIRSEDGGCYIGAGVSIEEIKKFSGKFFPELKPMLSVFASHQIRNVATLGGNLCTASPIGDLIPLMFALKAKFEIVSENGGRWVNAEDFIVGYRKSCLFSDELLMGIHIPRIDKDEVIKTEKVSNRRDLDISTVSIAGRLKLDSKNIVKEIILAYGGMAAVVKRANHVEDYLMGKEWTRKTVEKAMNLIPKDFIPISDARASKEYRMVVAENLLLKLVVE
jgi:xanthine dehydrogenase small subunit